MTPAAHGTISLPELAVAHDELEKRVVGTESAITRIHSRIDAILIAVLTTLGAAIITLIVTLARK